MMDSQRRQTGHAKVEPQWSRRKREVTKTTVSARPCKVALIVGWAEVRVYLRDCRARGPSYYDVEQ
jgi:hypothetical protein